MALLQLPGIGYHNGFTIPAGATCIQITQVSFNSIVFLGECGSESSPYILYVYVRIHIHICLSFFWPPAPAVTIGAVPQLNGGYSVVIHVIFQAGGARWNYTRGADFERLESPGPLSTSVHIQVKGTVHEMTYI